MSSDRLSRQYRHGALMRLAARHQNSAIVLRRRPTDGKNGDSGSALIPVYPTVSIRAGLGRSEKNVAKVNSTWTDTERNTSLMDYTESDDSSSIFNFDYYEHNGVKNLGEYDRTTIDGNVPHNEDMRDEEDVHGYGHTRTSSINCNGTINPKTSKTQEALIHFSQKSKNRKGKNSEKTGNEKNKAKAKSNIISRKLQALSCRNGINVIDGNEDQAERNSAYAIQEEFSQSREDSMGSENQHEEIQPSTNSDDYHLSRNRADLSLYKYYAGEPKENTKTYDDSEIDELVSRLRKGLKTKSG